MKNKPICTYCSNIANTREHIPAKNLFVSTSGVPFITVPSCEECNSGFQLDEEYFRNLLVAFHYQKSPAATFLQDNSVARSITRKPALGMKMFQQMQLMDVYDKQGNFLDTKTAVHMTDEDHKRIYNVLDKYIKGLFFHHFKRKVPENWKIRHHYMTPKFEELVKDNFKYMKLYIVKEDTFSYAMGYVPDNYQSIWCLAFYEQPMFYTFVKDLDN